MTTIEFITSEGDSFTVPFELCQYMITISDMLMGCYQDRNSPVKLENITSDTFHNIMIWIVEQANNNDCLQSPANAKQIDEDILNNSEDADNADDNDSLDDDDDDEIEDDETEDDEVEDDEIEDTDMEEKETESTDEDMFAEISSYNCDIDKHLSEMPFWDMSFLSRLSQCELFHMMDAVNYLNIPKLEKHACIYVAWLIKGKTVEEFRAFFKIRKNFTAAQKLLMEKENNW